MFGDDASQTNTTQATDGSVNPALPPTNIGDPLAGATTDDSSSSLPPVPTMDDSVAVPAPEEPTLDTPVVETPELTNIDVTPATEEIIAAAPALSLDPNDTTVTDDTSADDNATDALSDDTIDSDLDSPVEDTTPSEVPAGSEDLVEIKQQALSELSPLVDKLDQTPEERFRTTMMMIQASDNQALVKQAFEAAQAITDDKARAQALLDVINEINYFTTKSAV